MKPFVCLVTVVLIVSCSDHKNTYEEINFSFDSFDWDSNPYNFSSFINDSIMKTKGPQYASWDYSYIGDIENMLKTWDGKRNSNFKVTPEIKSDFDNYSRTDAIDFILDQAKSKRVVIINEAHHMPQHRVFTTRLLSGLKEIGFGHLGLESYFASAVNDSTFTANGYPTLKTGFYTKEPQFGNLLREAHHLGYKVFGYESRGHDDGKGREINQAKNIKDYLDKNPNSKLLIHCGFDHAYEGNLTSKWEKAMAGRFSEFTGIDPLTINQVVFSEKSINSNEDALYQLFDHDEASVYLTSENVSVAKSKNGGYNDIFVFHPRSKIGKRADWLIYDKRKEVDFSFEEAEINCPCLVLAYKKGEIIGSAVPYDIQESLNDKSATLVLDNSEFEIVILNENGTAIKTSL